MSSESFIRLGPVRNPNGQHRPKFIQMFEKLWERWISTSDTQEGTKTRDPDELIILCHLYYDMDKEFRFRIRWP